MYSTVERIERSFADLEKNHPPLAGMLAPFKALLVERARLREEAPDLPELPVPKLDPERLRQGVFWAADAEVFATDRPEWLAFFRQSLERLLPVMGANFPGLAREAETVLAALARGRLDLAGLFRCAAGGGDISGVAGQLGLPADKLAFLAAEAARPLLEHRAGQLGPSVPEGVWSRGECPLCGRPPEISILRGQVGQRFLRCSRCSHEWRFPRSQCPACMNDDHTGLEFLYLKDREGERAEGCRFCKRYLLGLDARRLGESLAPEAYAAGLAHLHLLAAESGYSQGPSAGA